MEDAADFSFDQILVHHDNFVVVSLVVRDDFKVSLCFDREQDLLFVLWTSVVLQHLCDAEVDTLVSFVDSPK